jgi:hypothetical protein
VERTLAEQAKSIAAREAHEGMARQYELEIERMTGGHIVFPWHRDEAVSARPSRSAWS